MTINPTKLANADANKFHIRKLTKHFTVAGFPFL